MIQLKARPIPDDLALGQLKWTAELINLVKKYKKYSKIPESEKSAILQNYNINGVKKSLKEMSNNKCCYCESKIDHVDFPHIEHFWPKSRYPKYAFKWSNLLLACKKCNLPKNEYDTKSNPFIHPVLDNPEEYLSYSELRIIVNPASPNKIKSKNTIEKCDLKRTNLFRLRANLLIEFNELEDEIDNITNEYKKLLQKRAQLKRVNKLHNSLDNLKTLCANESQYAGYVRFMARNSVVTNEAIKIINTHRNELGLSRKYEI